MKLTRTYQSLRILWEDQNVYFHRQFLCSTPVTRARFLSTWLLLLPLALYEPFKGSWNHVAEIPATALISVFLFGIDELSTQLEEPFTILPMQGFCDKIGMWCDEIVSWRGQGLDDRQY